MKVTDKNIREAIEKFLIMKEMEDLCLKTLGRCRFRHYIYISKDWETRGIDIDVFSERHIPKRLEVVEEIDIPDFEYIKSKYLEIIKLTEGEN